MKLIRWPVGLLFVLVGLVGLLASVVGIGGIWVGRTTIQEGVVKAAAPLEDALSVVKKHFGQADEALTETRTRVQDMKTTTAALASVDEETLQQRMQQLELDHRQLDLRLQEAGTLIQMSRRAVDTMTELTSYVKKIPNASLEAYSEDGPLSQSIKKAGDSLSELESSLGGVRETIQKIDENGTVNREQLTQLTSQLSAADEQLGQVQSAVKEFSVEVDKGEQELQKVKAKLPDWITAVAIVVTVILAWLGISQYALMVFGNSLMRA